MIYGRTRGALVWHLLYDEDDHPALCGIGAMRRQQWDSTGDVVPDGDLVCANYTRVNEGGNRRDTEATDA